MTAPTPASEVRPGRGPMPADDWPGPSTPETDPARIAEAARTMDAVVQGRYGTTGVLRVERAPRPVVGPDEVLVRVRAAGMDRGVWHLVSGRPYLLRLMGFGVRRPRHRVPGMDLAGTVVAAGAAVTRFRVGDEVLGTGRGTFAEYAVAAQDTLVRKPAGVPFDQAGAAAVSGITALQAVTGIGRLTAGQSVLVLGASGGVGGFAVQIAAAAGGVVTGVASAAKADLVRALGADRVLDYATDAVLDGSVRYDLVIDIGGNNPIRHLRRALAPAGTLVIVGGEDGGRITGGIGRQVRARLLSGFVRQRLTFFVSAARPADLETLADLMADGSVVTPVGARYRIDEVERALADLEQGRVRGKAVIVVTGTTGGDEAADAVRPEAAPG